MLLEGFEEFHDTEECPAAETSRKEMALGSARLLAAITGATPPRENPTEDTGDLPKVVLRCRRNRSASLWPRWYRPPATPMLHRRVLSDVARDFGIGLEELLGRGRRPHIVAARSVVARSLRDRGLSYPRIGEILGGRDHSTAINLIDRFDVYARLNPCVGWAYDNQRLAQ